MWPIGQESGSRVKDYNQCELEKAVENYFATSTPSLLAALLGFPKAEKSPTDRIGEWKVPFSLFVILDGMLCSAP